MNVGNRLSMQTVVDQITTSLADPTVFVGTCFHPQYLVKFAKSWPAVWVAAQRMTPTDDGRGFTSIQRQNVRPSLLIRLVVQRYPTDLAAASAEDRLGALHLAVTDALFGWKHPQALEPFVWESSVDGPPYEAVCTVDMIFNTRAVYSRS